MRRSLLVTLPSTKIESTEAIPVDMISDTELTQITAGLKTGEKTPTPKPIVDKVADKKGTRAVAEAYLKYWYTREGQEIAARNSYRPRDSEIAKEYEKSFAKVELFTIDDVFGGWTKAQKEHFAEGGIFDQIYKN